MKNYSNLLTFSVSMTCAASRNIDPFNYALIPNNTCTALKEDLTTLLDVIKARNDLSDLANSFEEPAGLVALKKTSSWVLTKC